ncbi:MAG TPA: hypothetical protein VFO25_03310 [Candidatus Eremiobacteraceae bacterium]|nr:hypothetical protein [Candidatus Eremiobacteraceae bacterium]
MLLSRVGRKPAVIAASLFAAVWIVTLAFVPAVSDQVGPVLRFIGINSCNKTTACVQYTNSGTGAGAQGTSLKGTGLVGVTQFNSTSASNGTSGISGKDSSTSGTFDSGISGLSVRGTGVSASSTSGNAIVASSTGGSGLIATSTNSDAIYATSTNFYGVGGLTLNNSTATGTGYAGVLAQDNSSDGGHLNSGVLGYSVNGFGVAAFSSNWAGANVIGGAGIVPALSLIAPAGADLIDACSGNVHNPCTQLGAFSVGDDGTMFTAGCIEVGIAANYCFTGSTGNVNIAGQYLKNGQCLQGCAAPSPTRPGHAVVSYVPTQSLPSIDDFGEASLQNGYAYVQLDPAFRNVVDRNASYLVFITPEGDSRGLYAAQKTAQGFAVRENMGGHSSLTFDYRIVAKPFGEQGQRLQMVTIPKLRTLSNPLRRTIPPKNR